MKFLQKFYNLSAPLAQNEASAQQIVVSGAQGSAFAKEVANDFNPIHDEGTRRFCVPGDLLFSIALEKYGLQKSMAFQFLDLVSADTPLNFPSQELHEQGSELSVTVTNTRDKAVLSLQASNDDGLQNDSEQHQRREQQAESLIREYVAFSGHNFPHILVPLMQEHNVMINPARPLVIYESMSFELEHLDWEAVKVKLVDSTLQAMGKRGDAVLSFSIESEGKQIGAGRKKLVLSGLREYQQEAIDAMCKQYQDSKQDT